MRKTLKLGGPEIEAPKETAPNPNDAVVKYDIHVGGKSLSGTINIKRLVVAVGRKKATPQTVHEAMIKGLQSAFGIIVRDVS